MNLGSQLGNSCTDSASAKFVKQRSAMKLSISWPAFATGNVIRSSAICFCSQVAERSIVKWIKSIPWVSFLGIDLSAHWKSRNGHSEGNVLNEQRAATVIRMQRNGNNGNGLLEWCGHLAVASAVVEDPRHCRPWGSGISRQSMREDWPGLL